MSRLLINSFVHLDRKALPLSPLMTLALPYLRIYLTKTQQYLDYFQYRLYENLLLCYMYLSKTNAYLFFAKILYDLYLCLSLLLGFVSQIFYQAG